MIEAYNGTDDYVFISYSHNDWEKIEPILERLKFETYRFWFDAGVSGGNTWNDFIADKLLNAKAMLLFLSETSANSKYVKGELQFALNHNIDIVPVYLTRFTLPIGLEILLTTIQSISIYDKTEIKEIADIITRSLPESVYAITEKPFYSGKNYSYYLEEYSVEVPATPPKYIASFKITRINEQTNEKQCLFSYKPNVLHGDCNRYTVTMCQTCKNDYFDECENSLVVFSVHSIHYFLDFFPYTRGEDFVVLFTLCIINPELVGAKVKLLDYKISTQSHPYSLEQDRAAIAADIHDDGILKILDTTLQD